jgi:predicted nucleic acid-binding protein
MSRFLLDTNVVSEVTKARPSPQVIAFLEEQEDLWLPTIVLHELGFGLLLLPEGQRQDRLRTALSAFIAAYDDRILPLDSAAAEWAARFRAHARHSGETLDLGDALIAGTAKTNDLTIATRNTKDSTIWTSKSSTHGSTTDTRPSPSRRLHPHSDDVRVMKLLVPHRRRVRSQQLQR